MFQNRVLRKIFGANTVEVNVPQPTALLPSHSTHSTQLYRSPLNCYPPTQHNPLNCTAAHCIVAAVWLRLLHISLPSCLSLPADCHLPLGGHRFCRSSLPLTLHEPAKQYVLNVTVVWTNAQTPPP